MWIGIDDTDSRFGGCTTYVAFELVKELQFNGYLVVGWPRLVRLNPNIPWKTRGNGAVSFHITKNQESCVSIGQNDEIDLMGCLHCSKKMCSDQDKKEIISLVGRVVESSAELKEDNTNPGFVVMKNPPDPSVYWKTVRTIMSLDEIIEILNNQHAYYKMYNNGRGIIGATAAISWRPSQNATFEMICYRKKNRWGLHREINEQSVMDMDSACPTTFDSYDYDNEYMCIAPHSPCPVLYGVRGTDADRLMICQKQIMSEPKQGWMLFETNQGTDDHLQFASFSDLKPFQSVIVKGKVCSQPLVLKGGHVVFKIKDNQFNTVDCVAYEPTKQFRSIIKKLCVGDQVIVYGGVREKPVTINIEKIKITDLATVYEKIENPLCPQCGKHMKSKGRNQGYHCKRCKTKKNNPIIKEKQRRLSIGFYEVPSVARRHLSKPLKLMK